MMKRILSMCMVLTMLTGCGAGVEQQSAANATQTLNISDEEIQAMTLESTNDIPLSEYENMEVLVQYSDGSVEVLSFEDEESLAEGLEQLSQDEAVAWFQPNYSYETSALSTTDTLTAYQWALSNDGSFQMEEKQNRYPVYESPFGTPYAPWQWIMPNFIGTPGGFRRSGFSATSAEQISAEPGIDINVEDAWALYDGGSRDVVIALIDTGIDYTHEDLQDVIWTNTGEIPGNNVDDDGNGYVDDVYGWNFYNNNNRVYVSSTDDSHGTHGAGTIAASADNGIGISGITNSDHVKIMSLKALGGSDGSGSTASIIRAIQYAEANGASICNLSLGSSTNDRALYQAIANSSMLFVVAAGNDGADTDTNPCYPASYELDNIISVANLNYNGALHYSSNYGTTSVDLAAPGSYILSTTPGNNYSYMTGTSMAAPMVTAAAAMLYSYYDDITLADVKDILLASVTELDTLTDSVATGGMLNLGAAMAYDTSTLSHETWDASVVIDSGTAPEILAETVSQGNSTYLVVQVTDADNDLSVTAYASGTLTAQQFQSGAVGKAFSVDSTGKVIFSVQSSGTFTFYARDSMGNETVKTVSVTARQNDYRSSPIGDRNRNSWPNQTPTGIAWRGMR